MRAKKQGRKARVKPTTEAPARAGVTQTTWVEGQRPASKEDGATILYDEPNHAIDPADATTWPPTYVDLSSAWVYRVVRNEDIPHTTRYTTWPTTFSSKHGLQATWKNKGRAAKVYNEEQNSWHYPVVFNSIQLHGEEGETAGLDAAELITGKPHNKHTIGIGRACLSENEEGRRGLNTPSSTTPQPANVLPARKQRTANTHAPKASNVLLAKRPVPPSTHSNTTPQASNLVPVGKQKALNVASSTTPQSPNLPPKERTALRMPNSAPQTSKIFPPAVTQETLNSPNLRQKAAHALSIIPQENPESFDTSLPVGFPEHLRRAEKRPLDQSTEESKRLKIEMFPTGTSKSSSRRLPVFEEESPTLLGEEAGVSSDTLNSFMERGAQMCPSASAPFMKKETDMSVEASHNDSASDSDSERTFDEADVHRYKDLLRSYNKLKDDHEQEREDHNDEVEESFRLESKLDIADGKVMLMTKALHASFGTLLEASKAVQMGSTVARSFLHAYGTWPDDMKKAFERHKQECDRFLEAWRTTHTAMKEVNTHYDKLETCFPRSTRITSDRQTIQDWCDETFATGDKAAEEGDHLVDGQGQIIEDSPPAQASV